MLMHQFLIVNTYVEEIRWQRALLSVEDVKNVLTVSLKQEFYADTSFQTSAGFLQSSPVMDLA